MLTSFASGEDAAQLVETPEPGSALLLLTGIGGLAWYRKQRTQPA